MSIELLWIIPIVAVALLVLVLVLNLQQNRENQWLDNEKSDLKREVTDYNNGIAIGRNVLSETSENRLRDIESTIKLVSTALSNQQKIIENFQGNDANIAQEQLILKNKLQELQHEYDIIISENYSLRARLKKIEQEHGIHLRSDSSTPAMNTATKEITEELKNGKVVKLKIYNKPRILNSSKPSYLDDTSEINMSEINN